MTGISIREFAKRDGCNDKLVRRAIKQGHLIPLPDGKLDPALVGSGWRARNRQAAEAQIEEARDLPERLEQLEMFVSQFLSGSFGSKAEGERVKENALAAKLIIELLIKVRRLVEIDDVAAIVGQQVARVRTRLLAIPAERAPRLAALKTVAEVQDFLLQAVTEALEELTGYAAENEAG